MSSAFGQRHPLLPLLVGAPTAGIAAMAIITAMFPCSLTFIGLGLSVFELLTILFIVWLRDVLAERKKFQALADRRQLRMECAVKDLNDLRRFMRGQSPTNKVMGQIGSQVRSVVDLLRSDPDVSLQTDEPAIDPNPMS